MNEHPNEIAEDAGLRYVSDDMPGYTRRRAGKGYMFLDPEGNVVKDAEVKKRLKALSVPPAWVEVWFSLTPEGHIQAVGRDAKGRKQYIYHPRWQEIRSEAKFDRVLDFGKHLPELRRHVERDLQLKEMRQRKVIAIAVALLDRAALRIGSENYARQNQSYGATTLRHQHVHVSGEKILLRFRAKSGKEFDAELTDRGLAKAVQRCVELPGQELLQYVDEDGDLQTVDSGEVNEYLREVTGKDFSAKDFRTWTGTVAVARALAEMGQTDSEDERKHRTVEAVKVAAEELGNTPAISRNYYVHPELIELYMQGREIPIPAGVERDEHDHVGLDPAEQAVLDLLDDR